MTTMAAVPGMDMAVATVIPAVGVTRTPLIVVTDPVGRSGDHPPLKEAILANTAARAVGRLGVVAAAAVGQIEEWPGADTEREKKKKKENEMEKWCFSLRHSKDFEIQKSALLNSGLQASVSSCTQTCGVFFLSFLNAKFLFPCPHPI